MEGDGCNKTANKKLIKLSHKCAINKIKSGKNNY